MAKVKLNAWASKMLKKVLAQVIKKVGVTETMLFVLEMIADMTETKADDKIVEQLKKALDSE
jgi:hypothetical protein|tara:strand:- start:3819 stop:4004 length:186 start_codon:yes stop_codon:yes gene_type:complete